jgi:hypothetical protein
MKIQNKNQSRKKEKRAREEGNVQEPEPETLKHPHARNKTVSQQLPTA